MPKFIKLYHGTLRESLPEILVEGLQPSSGWGGANTEGVFLSSSKQGAIYWAKMAYLRQQDDKLEIARFNRKYGDIQSELIAVISLKIPEGELDNLKADMEQAEDVGYEGDEDDWKSALEEIGDVRFDEPIPPTWFSAIYFPSLEKQSD